MRPYETGGSVRSRGARAKCANSGLPHGGFQARRVSARSLNALNVRRRCRRRAPLGESLNKFVASELLRRAIEMELRNN